MLFFAVKRNDRRADPPPEQLRNGTRRGRLLVISGPSGAGKGTLIGRVLPHLPNTFLSRSATTRPRRPEERQGREYYFLSPQEFEDRAKKGEFLEHVKYGSSSYGTLKSVVEDDLAAGRNVILEIELEGARNVRRLLPEAALIFIAPPDFAELESRLRGRSTEAEEEVAARLERAREELASRNEFDYIIVNQTVDQAAAELEKVIKTELEGGSS